MEGCRPRENDIEGSKNGKEFEGKKGREKARKRQKVGRRNIINESSVEGILKKSRGPF